MRSSAVLVACALALRSGSLARASAPAAEAARPPQTIPLQPSRDGELQARLTSILHEMDGLEGVEVRVRNGVVHLAGTTNSPSLTERATKTAERLEGVVHVRSEIVQPPSRWGPLAPIGRTLARIGRAVVDFLPELVVGVVVFLPFAGLSALVRRWRRPFRRLGVSHLTGTLLRVGLRALLIVAGLLAMLDVLGVMAAVGAVVGTLGVLGVVAGFVFKDWVSVYLPGLMLGLRPPFKAGDLVRIEDREGRVAHITPSATVLVTTDGEEVRVPNVEIFKKVLVNLSMHRTRRLRFRLALAYDADLGLCEAVGRHAMLAVRGVKDDPAPFMRVQVLGREEVEVEFFAWVDQDEANFRNVESRAKRAVLDALHEHRVPLAALSVIVRRQVPPESFAGPNANEPTVPRAEPEIAAAEDGDEALLERRFAEVRARRTERDLLEDGHDRSEPSVMRSADLAGHRARA